MDEEELFEGEVSKEVSGEVSEELSAEEVNEDKPKARFRSKDEYSADLNRKKDQHIKYFTDLKDRMLDNVSNGTGNVFADKVSQGIEDILLAPYKVYLQFIVEDLSLKNKKNIHNKIVSLSCTLALAVVLYSMLLDRDSLFVSLLSAISASVIVLNCLNDYNRKIIEKLEEPVNEDEYYL